MGEARKRETRLRRHLSWRPLGDLVRTLLAVGALVQPLCVTPARAQSADARLWGVEPDAAVMCSLRLGEQLFLGGYFHGFAPNTGSALAYTPSGLRYEHWPRVAGIVWVIEPDGSGGWYIGGRFTGVGELPRRNLAHVTGDGRVSRWAPDPNGDVWCIEVAGDKVYVGGDFTEISGAARKRAARFGLARGDLQPWRVDCNATVLRFLSMDSSVIVAGVFDDVNGEHRRYLAECSSRTGEVSAWNPSPDYPPRALARSGNRLFVGGQFFSISGNVNQRFLAAYSFPGGELLPWDAVIRRKPDYLYDGGPRVEDLLVRDSLLYVAGAFGQIGGVHREGLAAVGLESARVSAWDPRLRLEAGQSQVPATCRSLATDGAQLIVCGVFDSLAGRPAARSGSVYFDQAMPARWFPELPRFDELLTVAAGGGVVWVGGRISTDLPSERRDGLAVIDMRTGALSDWRADTDGRVTGLGLSRGRLIVLGGFGSIGGVARPGLAALDPATGQVLDWSPPGSNGLTWCMAATDSVIYIGGDFTSVGSAPRLNLAALDPVTGEVLPWAPDPRDMVLAIHPAKDVVYVGGFFFHVAGVVRAHAAALDPVTGQTTPWVANTSGVVETILTADTCVYLGGGFHFVNGMPRDGLAEVSARTGMPTAFRADVQEVRVAFIEDSVLYIGGQVPTIGGVARNNVGAIERHTGRVLDWHPEVDGQVWSLSGSAGSVYIGGRFNAVGPTPCTNIAAVSAFSWPTPSSQRLNAIRDLGALTPTGPQVVMSLDLVRDADVTIRLYDVMGRMVYRILDKESMAAGPHQITRNVGTLASGVYLCKVDAGSDAAVAKLVLVR